jgi:hypothetical protein
MYSKIYNTVEKNRENEWKKREMRKKKVEQKRE